HRRFVGMIRKSMDILKPATLNLDDSQAILFLEMHSCHKYKSFKTVSPLNSLNQRFDLSKIRTCPGQEKYFFIGHSKFSMSDGSSCWSLDISRAAFFPKIDSNFSARIFPVPGRFTQILSFVKNSPLAIWAILHTV